MVVRQALAALLLLGGCGGVGAGSGASGGETKGEDETQEESEEFPECDLLGGAGEELHTAIYTDESAWIYSPRHVVADSAYVYFADGRGIYRVLRCGGEAEELFPGFRPFNDGLAIADGALYWIQGDDGTTGPTILTAPVSGGDPVALIEYEGYSHRIRVSGETILWNVSISGFPDESQLHVVNIDGSDHRVLARNRYGWSFDLNDDVVYAAGYLPESDPGESDRVLFSLPVAGGAPTILVDGFGDDYPTGVEVGDDEVYYLRAKSSDILAIERVSKEGGPASALDLGGATIPDTLHFAGGQLYGVTITGDVLRIVDGEAPVSLASAETLGVESRVFADAGGLFVGDSVIECIEWWSDPSGEPPGETCVLETNAVRLLSLGR